MLGARLMRMATSGITSSQRLRGDNGGKYTGFYRDPQSILTFAITREQTLLFLLNKGTQEFQAELLAK